MVFTLCVSPSLLYCTQARIHPLITQCLSVCILRPPLHRAHLYFASSFAILPRSASVITSWIPTDRYSHGSTPYGISFCSLRSLASTLLDFMDFCNIFNYDGRDRDCIVLFEVLSFFRGSALSIPTLTDIHQFLSRQLDPGTPHSSSLWTDLDNRVTHALSSRLVEHNVFWLDWP